MAISVTELDPPAKDAFEPFAMRLEVTSLEDLRALKDALASMPGGSGLQEMSDFLKGKLQRYEKVA